MPTPDGFEARLQRIEEIVARLESSSLSLDDSLKAFEEGIGLLRLAAGDLAAAETKIRVLTESADGAFVLRDFDTGQ